MRVIMTLLMIASVAWTMPAHAEVPRLTSYQGVVKDDLGNVVPGADSLHFAFRIYNAQSGGSPLWEESKGLMVRDGILNTLLGDTVPLDIPFDEQYWLGVSVESEDELEPRVSLSAAPYALRAATADSIAGGGAVSDGDWVISGEDMYSAVQGNVGIGTTDPLEALDLDGNLRMPSESYLHIGSSGGVNRLYLGKPSTSTGDVYRELVIRSRYSNDDRTLTLRAGGTTVNSALQASSDLLLQPESGTVGVGTDAPDAKLHVATGMTIGAHIQANANMAGTGLLVDWDGDYNDAILRLRSVANPTYGFTDDDTKFLVTGEGDVGIGTQQPASELHVAGDVQASRFRPELSVGILRPDDDGELRITGGSNFSFVSDGVRGSGIIVRGRDHGGPGAGGDLLLYAVSGKKTYFRHVSTSGSVTERMLIDSNGNVGIGTTAPAYRLDVDGPVGASEFHGDGSHLTGISGTTDGDWVIDGDNVYHTQGRVGVGTSSPTAKLHCSVDSGHALRALTSGNASGQYAVAGVDSGSTSNSFGVYGETWSRTNGLLPGQAGAGSAVGVYGRCRAPVSRGGATLGVLGRVDANSTEDGSDAAVGVFGWAPGVTEGAPAEFSARCYGVWGETWSQADYVSGVYGVNKSRHGQTRGVIGVVHSTVNGTAGVLGWASSDSGDARGVWGGTDSADGAGVFGSAVGASSDFGVFCYGNLGKTGTAKSVLPTSRGYVSSFSLEASEAWIEDVGEARLDGGQARIALDPVFLEVCTVDERHPLRVFVQLNDDCHGVYVKTDLTGFDVVELQGGTSAAAFTYRVLAKRHGFEDQRFPRAKPMRTAEHGLASR